MANTETTIPLGNGQYLVFGQQSVTTTSGAGTLTLTSVAVIDSVLNLDDDLSTATVTHVWEPSAVPTDNTVAVLGYTNTLSGPVIALAADAAHVLQYCVIGH